jgi:hypothetical protein
MSTEADTTRAAVAALLAANEITFSAIARGERVKDKTKENPRGWTCDAWSCAFTKRDGRAAHEEFEFFTGTGHRKPGRKPLPSLDNVHTPQELARWNEKHARPVAPHAADVLYSIILDSSAVGQSFRSWCSEYGYDTDSRKAEETYRACQRNADKLARVMGHALIAEMSTVLQDY